MLIATTAAVLMTACYPRYDWRDHRPDCAQAWCGFTATFPGKPQSATREMPVGALRLPLSATIVSVGEVSFAVLSFDLRPDSDATAARALLEKKLLDDVGASRGDRKPIVLRAADRSEIVAERFDAQGMHDRTASTVFARMAEHRGHLVEIFVIGPTAVLATDSGRQAVETFMTSLRLD